MKSLRTKLLLVFLLLAGTPLLFLSFLSVRSSMQALQAEVENNLNSKADYEIKRAEFHIKKQKETVVGLASTPKVVQALTDFTLSFPGGTNSPAYLEADKEFQPYLTSFKEKFGYYDLFLISARGDIVFNDSKEADFGTNLKTGPYMKSELARAFDMTCTQREPIISDFREYPPSEGAYAVFITAPVFNEGDFIGVVALQLSAEFLYKLAVDYAKLGETGEIVFASLDGNEVVFIAPRLNDADAPFNRRVVIGSEKGKPIQKATMGGEGSGLSVDYRGKEILAAWRYIPEIRWGMVVKIDADEAFQAAAAQKSFNIFLCITAAIVVLIAGLVVSWRIVNPLNKVVKMVERLANGESVDKIPAVGVDEVGQLVKSVNVLIDSNQSMIDRANMIAEGNFTAEMTPRSDQDKLGIALNKMMKNLRTVSAQNKTAWWIKTGQTELNDAMRGELDFPTLSKNVITYLAKYLDAQVGVVYLSDDDGTLRLTGGYAFTQPKHLANTIKPGESLVGQAALEKKSISISNVPEDYFTVNSGLGEAVPRNLLAIPLVLEGKVKGVLELGTFNPFNNTQLEFLKLVSENIASVINSTQNRKKMNLLLKQSVCQTGELKEKSKHLAQQKANIEQKNRDLEAISCEIEEKAIDLELANKYKSEFLANMSHELRTPLNSLLILSKSLADNDEGNLTDEQVESAKVINEGGGELLNLINEILDLSKIEAGKIEIHIENVDLDSIRSRVQSQFGHIAEEKGIRLQIEIDEQLPKILETDGQRVEQVLNNLISNALKFTEEGSVTLSIHRPDNKVRFHQASLTSENTVAMSVIDTGIGISEDRQKSIFEAFQQADGSTSRKYGGTGLGLTISRELTKLLGGEIQIQSRKGKGSTFNLYLPLKLQAAPPVEQPLKEAAPSPSTSSHEQTDKVDKGNRLPKPSATEFLSDDRHQIAERDRTVLIIEDDLRFAKILLELSRKQHYKCLVAGDGSSGLQLASEFNPTAILLDLRLSDFDGHNILGQLKFNLATRHIPVHVVSTRDENATSLRKGAVWYLAKPASMEDLDHAFSKIEGILNRDVRKVLIVEDDEVQRKNLVKMIDSKGVEITGVSTGEEAVAKISSQKFDGVILDLGLPDMTGFELLRRLKDLPCGEIPPMVIYTARDLTREEHAELSKYTDSIVLKEADSEECVLDEVLLFLQSVEASLPAEQQKVPRLSHDPDQALKDRKILLVDDDKRNVFALSKVLQRAGLNVVTADNGKMALEKLETEKDVDLVVMDIMMPVMDGYEAMKAIRAKQRFEKLPIIAHTARAMPEDRAKCLKAGANDYLSKPSDVEELLSLFKQHFPTT